MADVHCGNHPAHGGPQVDGLNRRGRETVEVLRRALAAVRRRGCEHLAVAGDLFHSRRPEPAVIRAVQDALALSGEGVEVLLVPGNHDMLDASAAGGNTAMAPLHRAALVATLPGWYRQGELEVLAVPFEGTRPMSEHLVDFLGDDQRSGGRRSPSVLVTHVGVWDGADAPPWQRRARDGIQAEALARAMAGAGIPIAFVGNYHEPREWSLGPLSPGSREATRIVQVGTLCPATHGDAGLESRGRIAFLEADGSVTFEEVPGPRFVTATHPAPGGPYWQGSEGTSFYVRWMGPAGTAPAVEDQVVAVDVEDPPSPGASNRAGKEEESPDTDEGAIEAFVAGMELPEGAARAAVRELVLDCWRRA